MSFFKRIKGKLEDALIDISTVEHAMIIEEENGCVYRFQQTDGDNIAYISDTPIDEAELALFNDAFLASIQARNDITQFIIECLT
jgi:hypothetical protein